MMKTQERGLMDFPVSIREALAVFEMYRRLGFSSEKIFFVERTFNGEVGVQVKDERGTTFTAEVGSTYPEALVDWQKAATSWNDITRESDRQAVYRGSNIIVRGAEMILAMRQKGLDVPLFSW